MSGTIGSSPVIVVRDVSVAPGQRIAAASMIVSASDPSGAPISQYGFWDGGSGDGHFTVNDVVQPSGDWIFVAANQLATIAYVGGVGIGAESLFVQAFSANGESNFGSVNASTSDASAPTDVNHAPVIVVQDVTLAPNAVISAASLIRSVTDPDGNPPQRYAFYDNGTGGGHFDIVGEVQPAEEFFYVEASALATVQYVGGATDGIETLSIAVSDGKEFSAVGSLTATTGAVAPAPPPPPGSPPPPDPNRPPVVKSHDITVAAGQSVSGASLISSVTDPDADPILLYAFYYAGKNDGYFAVNGEKKPNGYGTVVAP
ncbi:MAG: hypothetical protein H7251_09615, partial [Acetobacteraceae bacterium]|nr:hypothetical protein [Acetobacteraceae bacterium]